MRTATKITAALLILNEIRGIAVATSLGPDAIHSASTGTMPDASKIGFELLFLAIGFLAIWAIRRTISAYRPKWVEPTENDGVMEFRYTITERKVEP